MRTAPLDYTSLLQRLQAQDRMAFDLLYRDTRVTLFVVALDILEDETAAQDLVQDFFIDFWQRELYRQVESSLKGYLLRAIRNRAIKLLKKEQTQRKLQFAWGLPESLVPPSQRMERDQLAAAIAVALAKVPVKAAEVFILHYVEALSHAQIATQLNISVHTVRNQVAKALRILRKELKNN